MASRKEYEMLFKLNASLGNDFNASFRNAQTEIQNLQKKIAEYNNTLRDISAYERQKSHIDALIEKKKSLEQSLEKLNQQYKAGEITEAGYVQGSAKLNAEIATTTQRISESTAKLDTFGERLKEAGVDTSNLTGETKRYKDAVQSAKQEQTGLAEHLQTLSTASESTFASMSEMLLSSGIIEKFKELGEAFKACVDIATQFGWSMANVTAITGATGGQIEQLTAKAKQLGADTRYTATEAADAMGYMAMAGWKTEEMLAGMDGVIQLAAASGTDLATTSSIITDSISAFGLAAQDTAHFADVLAAGATNSNTTVEYMGQTFRYAASTAGALGYTIEDVAVAMGLMANRGIKGSMAGTALRMTFAQLAGGATLVADAFKTADNATGEYEFSSVNADGSMKSFAETLDILRDKFSQMTAQEKIQNAQALVGVRSFNGLLAMVNASQEEYDKLSAAINDCTGAAQKMASVQMDSVQGDLYLLTSAWDALKTSIGELFGDEIRSLYKTAKDITSWFDELVNKNPAVVKAIMAFVGVFGSLTVAVTGAYTAIKLVASIMPLFAGGFAAAFPVVAGVSAVIAGLAAALVYADSAVSKEEKEFRLMTATAREQSREIEALKQRYQELCDTQGATSSEAQLLKKQIDEESAAFKNATTNAEDFYSEIQAVITANNELVANTESSIGAIDAEAEGTEHLIEKLFQLDSATDKGAAGQAEMLAIVELLNQRLPSLGLAYDTNIQKLNLTAEAVNKVAKAEAERKANEAKWEALIQAEEQTEALKSAKDSARAEMEARKKEYQEALKKLNEAVSTGEWTTIETVAVQDAQFAWEQAIATYQAAFKAAYANDELIKKYSADIGAFNEEQQELADGSTSSGITRFNELTAQTTKQLNELAEAYDQVLQSALDSITGQFSLWDEWEKTTEHSDISQLSGNIAQQTEHFKNYKETLEGLLDRMGDDSTVTNFLSQFTSGSQEDLNALTSLSKMSDKEIQDMAESYEELKNTQRSLAEDITEMSVDLQEQMDNITNSYTEDIKALDLHDAAYAAMSNTVQGMIDGVDAKTVAFSRKVEELTNTARNLLFSSTDTGYSTGTNATSASTWYGGRTATTGYASGTNSATAGWHIVGEQGPELAYFSGGEQVINADKTASLLGGNNISIAFNIAGKADNSTVGLLQSYADDFAERVLAVIEDASADSLRRAYA